MTINEAANKLIDFFSKSDSFCMEDNYSDLILISDKPDEDKIAFLLALEDLEKNDLIKGHSIGKKKIYILKKPFSSFDQSITINSFTSNMIAKVINDFCEKIKDKRDFCDVKSINEKDIRNLIFLASMNSCQDKSNNELDA